MTFVVAGVVLLALLVGTVFDDDEPSEEIPQFMPVHPAIGPRRSGLFCSFTLAAKEAAKARCRVQLELSPVLPRERDRSRVVLFSNRRIIPACQRQIAAAQPTGFSLDLLNLRCVGEALSPDDTARNMPLALYRSPST
jgi:hypothetical protein